MLQTKDLMLIQALAQGKSVRRAAESLRVHQSTLFRRLDALEQDLGVRVFERLRDGYTLTPAGERIFQLAQHTQQELDALERQLRGQDMRPYGVVRVTSTDTLVLTVLSPIFAAFRSAHPEIELEVNISNEMLLLTKREADVAVRPTLDVPDNLVGKSICSLAVTAYASRSYWERHGGVVADFGAHPWIGPDDSLAHLRWIRSLHKTYPNLAVPYRINTVQGMLCAAKAGAGLVMLPCYLGDGAPELVRLRPPSTMHGSKLWLLTHPDLRQVARVRAFFDFVGAELAKLKPAFEGQPDARASTQ